jgi:hypothetical protein
MSMRCAFTSEDVDELPAVKRNRCKHMDSIEALSE